MTSEPTEQDESIEARATAFVFGELNRDQATEFMKSMDASPELRLMVASIRDAVGAVKAELDQDSVSVTSADRRRIESAIQGAKPEPPPVVAIGQEMPTRKWVIGLATAASLLLASGLTFPALNRVISANTETRQLRDDLRKIESENELLKKQTREIRMQLESIKAARVDGDRSESDLAISKENTDAEPELDQIGPSVGGSQAGRSSDTIPPKPQPSDLVESTAIEITEQERLGSSPPSQDDLDAVATQGSRPAQPDIDSDQDNTVDPRGDDTSMGSGGALLAETDALRDAARRKGVQAQLVPRDPRRIRGPNPIEVEMLTDESDAMEMVAGGAGGFQTARLGMADPLDPSSRYYGIGASTNAGFAPIIENAFLPTLLSPLSTFTADVDIASYDKIRTYIESHNQLPSPDWVRIEELLNYFQFDYAPPEDDRPFAAAIDVAQCPWNPRHRLARIGIKGMINDAGRPPSNLVFLLDVSGSMNRPNKLPLMVHGIKSLVDQLGENDTIAIVAYAGAAGLVLDSTTGDRKKVIVDALGRIRSGGTTNRGRGIQLAYSIARDHFVPGGTNRVVLCSDGNFNVGVTGTDQVVRIVEENAGNDIFLTVLGFGTDYRNEAIMDEIRDKGKGQYTFIDDQDEAVKVLVDQIHGSSKAIANDIQIQVEFNPVEVASYRLIGYENQTLSGEELGEDGKDAGEIGAGQTITALYELNPQQVRGTNASGADGSPRRELKYRPQISYGDQATSGELLTLNLHYKTPGSDEIQRIEFVAKDSGKDFESTDRDFHFAASIAAFGMLLRNSAFKGSADFDLVEELASAGAAGDRSGYREEFLSIVRHARALGGR